MAKAVVLLYNLQEEQAKQVALLASKQFITARVVLPQEYHQTLGALCGLKENTGETCSDETFKDEMLVMANFKKGMLNNFLDSFRENGLPSIPLKAMLTETNSKWDSIALHKELKGEYEYFKNLQAKEKEG